MSAPSSGRARGLALLLAAAFVSGGLLVLPLPVQAEPLPNDPIIYVEPDCFTYAVGPNVPPVTTTITVRGHNFDRNRDIVVSNFERDFNTPASETITTSGNFGVFSTTLTISVQLYYYYNRITAGYDQGDVQAEVYILSCATTEVTVNPNCVPAGQATSISVSGTGFQPTAGAIVITVYDWYTGKQYAGMERPAAATFTATLNLPALPIGEYRVWARQGNGVPGASVRLLAPCPTITLTPTCGPPGSPPDEWSIFVTGSGFMRGHGPEGEGGVDIIFEPERRTQEFFYRLPYYEQLSEGGRFGPVEITPYRRGAAEATYTVEVIQRDYDRRVLSRATATFTVPCPITPSPTPQFRPTLTVDPDCGPPAIFGDEPRTYDLQLAGRGFAPLAAVIIVFDADGVALPLQEPQTFTAASDRAGSFDVTIEPDYRPPGTFRIAAIQQLRIGLVEGSAFFAVPCVPPAPVLTIDPTCGPAARGQPQAYAITAVGSGFAPGPVEVVFDPQAEPESNVAVADDAGAFTIVIAPTGRAPGLYAVVARQLVASGIFAEASVPFVVACEGALLSISPSLGPRGMVAIVLGVNFRPSAVLELNWNRGIDAGKPIAVETDENGAFRRPVMIYRSDFVGPRRLTVLDPSDPEAYLELFADYVVGIPPLAPPFADNPWGDSTMVSR